MAKFEEDRQYQMLVNAENDIVTTTIANKFVHILCIKCLAVSIKLNLCLSYDPAIPFLVKHLTQLGNYAHKNENDLSIH